MTSFYLIVFWQLVVFVATVSWFFYRNDEVPILIAAIIGYSTVYRYWVILNGWNNWININTLVPVDFSNALALSSLREIMVGQTIMIFTYMVLQKRKAFFDLAQSDVLFARRNQKKLFLFSLLCLSIVFYVKRNSLANLVSGGSVLAYGWGYLFLLPLVLVGGSTLLTWTWVFGGIQRLERKIFVIFLLVLMGVLNYSSSMRFQIIGGFLASIVIVSFGMRPTKKFLFLLMFLFFGAFVFGVLRTTVYLEKNQSGRSAEMGFTRLMTAEDANMLDGYILLKYVYPEYLPYQLGKRHLEILTRPIPRAIWKNKPIGGAASYIIGTSGDEATLGFAPTIFGDFYSEGGLLGICFFSFLYGWLFSKLAILSRDFAVSAVALGRAVFISSLIPLLRGGDIAGIFAWIGMAFWPVFLFLYINPKYIWSHFYKKKLLLKKSAYAQV